jgi:hypothetical protein
VLLLKMVIAAVLAAALVFLATSSDPQTTCEKAIGASTDQTMRGCDRVDD